MSNTQCDLCGQYRGFFHSCPSKGLSSSPVETIPTPPSPVRLVVEDRVIPTIQANIPYHKVFTEFNEDAFARTKALFESRPSLQTPEERVVIFENWVNDMSDIYNMSRPRFIWDEDTQWAGGGIYRHHDHAIIMSKSRQSVITLIHEFRHALQLTKHGEDMKYRDREDDARAWSLSLYYLLKPTLLEKLVREGKVYHIKPEDFD
jgi:hypothetical protein